MEQQALVLLHEVSSEWLCVYVRAPADIQSACRYIHTYVCTYVRMRNVCVSVFVAMDDLQVGNALNNTILRYCLSRAEIPLRGIT